MSDILESFQTDFQQRTSSEPITFAEYLEEAKVNSKVYATPAERMLEAIGEPEMFDTRTDQRLGRIFNQKVIRRYKTFQNFFGIEPTIDEIYNFFKCAAQNLEESRQVLYLLGPVGSSKSSLVHHLKALFEGVPVWVVDGSPVFDSPLNIFGMNSRYAKLLEDKYQIPDTAVRTVPSPWFVKRLMEVRGDLNKLQVRKVYPSELMQVCISRVEPGDENNQDISTLTGKLDIRKLEKFAQDDPDAYSYSGGLCRGNNGVMEFVEMFKTPIKLLNPLLTCTQERKYKGTEAISALPFDGIIIAHSNESEWQTFRNNKANEALVNRCNLIRVPYTLRVDEEIEVYKKILGASALRSAPCAPGTLELMAQFAVMSRLAEHSNSTLYSKMRVYNGENIKSDDPKAKPLQEYRDAAGIAEGMSGISTRFAYKVLSKTFNFDNEEVAANPIHLMFILEEDIVKEQLPNDQEEHLKDILKNTLADKYFEFLEKDIRASFLDSFSDLCQNVFETYFYYADAYNQDNEYRDPATGVLLDQDQLNEELSKIEKPAQIANPKEFRNDIVNFTIRYRAAHGGKLPRWNENEKMRTVIEKKVLATTDEILPVISFMPKRSEEEAKKHQDFVSKMKERGYTERQTKLLCEWFMRVRKSS